LKEKLLLKEASWQLQQIACPALRPVAQAVLQEKRAGYQEALAEQYLEDLRNKTGLPEGNPF